MKKPYKRPELLAQEIKLGVFGDYGGKPGPELFKYLNQEDDR